MSCKDLTCSLRSTRYPAPEKPRQKRAVIQDMVRPLKQWLLRHRHNPYPTKAEKLQLAVGSNMTLVQVKFDISFIVCHEEILGGYVWVWGT